MEVKCEHSGKCSNTNCMYNVLDKDSNTELMHWLTKEDFVCLVIGQRVQLMEVEAKTKEVI